MYSQGPDSVQPIGAGYGVASHEGLGINCGASKGERCVESGGHNEEATWAR